MNWCCSQFERIRELLEETNEILKNISMKKILLLLLVPSYLFAQSSASSEDHKTTFPDAKVIIEKVDKNMTSKSQIVVSSMIIYGKRNDRTITSKSYNEGREKSFTEYLSPEREKGTKMLKLDDKLWIYSPATDRTIQLSGHMLKQSVMGSDLSYEDMVDDRKLTDSYDAKVIAEDVIAGRKMWVLELNAIVEDVSYVKRKMWVDQERNISIREELYAKSGKLLKKVELGDVQKIGTRWYPKKINYRDMLKDGKGTDFIINEIEFDPTIPPYIFSKASLKK